MYKKILLETKTDNKIYICRYINFIESCKDNNAKMYIKDGEFHHILPKSIFCEYKNFTLYSWNKVKLTLRQHFLAHWMLAKIFGGHQWFSFNQMRRWGGTSILYEYGRKYHKEEQRKLRLGIVATEITKEKMRLKRKNQIVVKDINGNKFATTTFDPKYISGELVPHQLGSRRDDIALKNLKEKNGIKGKKPFITFDGKQKWYKEEEGLLLGYKQGFLETTLQKNKDNRRRMWVTNIESKKIIRINPEDFDDKKYIRGRIGFEGFKYINSNRRKNG
jgi:hypothetical protein